MLAGKTGIACMIVGVIILVVGLFMMLSKSFRQRYGSGFGGAMFVIGSLVLLVAMLLDPDITGSQKNNAPETTTIESGISDTLTFDDLEITVNNYVFSKNLGNIKGLTKAGDGNVWCTVYLDVKNVSKTTKSLCSSFNTNYSFTLEYKDGYTYYSTHQDYSEFLYAHEDIAALETLRNVCVSFEVPSEVEKNTDEPLHIKVSKNSKSAKDYAEWKLR